MQIYFSPVHPTMVPYCEEKEVAMEFLLGILLSLEKCVPNDCWWT